MKAFRPMRVYPRLARTARAALALLLAFAVPVRAETTTDPLWYLLSTYVLAPDAKAVEAESEGPADAKGLAGLQADLLVISDGLEAFRDESQVKETLARLKPRMSPELKPFFNDRASSLDATYRTLAVTDYTWAQRFPEPSCDPIAARRKLLHSRDGLFQAENGEASPWLVSLLGPEAVGKSGETALDQASSQAKLGGSEYEKLRVRVRRLTLALASDKAVGAARSKLYCFRAAAFENLAAHHRAKEAGLIEAGRAVALKPEESVFVVVWKNQRAAATLLRTRNGAILVTDAAIVADTDHPYLFAYSKSAKPVELAATVVRRHPELSVAALAYTENQPRPALALAENAPAKDDLVTAVGHTSVSGLWTKISGLVIKVGEVSFQTDAAVSPELSGAPVLNAAGEVAGMLVLRPADTEEGRWPIAIPAPLLARWLDDPAFALSAAPATESIEDWGTAAVLSHARPNALTEASLPDWVIPGLPPPPSVPNGVCVANCGESRSPSSSYSRSSSGSASTDEFGEALGQLALAMVFKGIPMLFRGLGKLSKGSEKPGSSPSVVDRSKSVKVEPKKEPPKPPDPILTLTVTTEKTKDSVIFTARITGNRQDIRLDGIAIDFTVNTTESASAVTNASGIVVLTVNNPSSIAALESLDEESAKHPWLTNASKGITKQDACKVTLIGATIAVAALAAVRAPVVVLTTGGLALKAPKPAVVKACVGIAGATTAAAAAACASMLGEEVSKPATPAPSWERPEVVPSRRVKTSVAASARKGEDLVRTAADSAQDDLKKAEQDNAAEEGAISPENMTGPADPGAEPPEEEPSEPDESQKHINGAQQKKLSDFEKNLPRSAGKITVRDLPNGGKAFQADVPARNIPGSFARYEKQIDVMGNTTSFTKTTFGSDGRIIHVRVTDGLEKRMFFPEP